MMMYTLRILPLLLLLCVLPARSQELEPAPHRQPTSQAVLFGIGRTNQYDTYLSPLEYKGVQASFLTQRERMTHLFSRRLSFQSTLQGAFTHTKNPAGTAFDWGGRIAYDAGWHYHHSLAKGLSVKGGLLLGTDLGFLYNNRNGNNPAQGHLSIDASLSAGGDYSFRLWRLPLRVGYQADLPVAGVIFSPEFGESYYEMSQHGVGKNILFAHPGNALSLRQLLTFDVCFRRTTLRLAYLSDIRQSNTNQIAYHDISRSFMLGFVRHFQLLQKKK